MDKYTAASLSYSFRQTVSSKTGNCARISNMEHYMLPSLPTHSLESQKKFINQIFNFIRIMKLKDITLIGIKLMNGFSHV